MNKEEIIKHYKTIFNCEQFVVTGSYVMGRIGLIDQSNVNDLDIILVQPTPETVQLLDKLVKDQPARTKGSGSTYIFEHEKVKIDVFVVNTKIPNTLSLTDGFEISTIKRIVDEKRKMNRPKDWVQLFAISRKFLKPDDFNSFLDTVYPDCNGKSCACKQ
jgi:hypothetical protein